MVDFLAPPNVMALTYSPSVPTMSSSEDGVVTFQSIDRERRNLNPPPLTPSFLRNFILPMTSLLAFGCRFFGLFYGRFLVHA